MNGNVKEWAIRSVAGLALTGTVGYLARIDGRLTEVEALQRVRTEQLNTIQRDISEIKLDIRDIPRGEGGMTLNERRQFRQMQEDLACIRGFLSGQSKCPP